MCCSKLHVSFTQALLASVYIDCAWVGQGTESKPAPGDAGTDSGEDDDAKLASSAAEQPQPARAAADDLAGKRSGAAGIISPTCRCQCYSHLTHLC